MIFRALFGGTSKRGPVANLPAVHTFVDVMVGGRAGRSVTIESIDGGEIVVREMVGRPGETAVFVYSGEHGKFRFGTKILRAGNGTTVFASPARVERVGGASAAGGSQKRASVRAFRQVAFKVIAAGDSYNDTGMLSAAHAGFFIHPPESITKQFPQFPVTRNYAELTCHIDAAAEQLRQN